LKEDARMALLKISKLGHPVLRQLAVDVDPEEITQLGFQRFLDDMADTMRESDGVGLAAPQVYVSKRIIVIEVKGPNPRYPNQPPVPLTVLINPRIVQHTPATHEDWEGCLSIPDLRGKVPRFASVEVAALDRAGKPVSLTAEGFFARIIQHEIDHLDGKIFIERMSDLHTLTHLREFQKFWASA
jgi:peptide deformylase